MTSRVGHLVGLDDLSSRIDQVADPIGIVGELVIGVAQHLIGRTDVLVEIGQELEREAMLLPERLVVGGGVEGDSEYGAVGVGECLSLITQALALKRSTGCAGFGVPPEQHPASSLCRQGGLFAVGILRGELGSLRTG